MSTLSQRMDFRLRLYGAESRTAGRAFWARPDLAPRYPHYLMHVHDSIRASASLLDDAAALCEARAGEDPVCAILGPYYRGHAEEERGHDLWVLEDLEVLGTTREEVLSRVPSAWAATLVGAFHYWIRNAHPISLMGYLIALEWSIPSPRYIEEISAGAGLPLEAFSCAMHHARLDHGHRAAMEAVLDALPIRPFQETLVGLGLMHSCRSMASLFTTLAEAPLSNPRAPMLLGAPSSTLLQEAP